MLYLEDYLEMIEHFPQELRDRFTEMRELDLTVQNNMDSLEKKTRTFFQQCKRGDLQNEHADRDFQNLRKEYYKVLEDADEKVNIATQIHELVERYVRRLDSELFKFKCELEADNNGITEILEKRSLELDGGSSAATALMNVIGVTQKENRYFGSIAAVPVTTNTHGVLSHPITPMGALSLPTTPTTITTKDNRYRTPRPEKRRDSISNLAVIPEKRPTMGNNTLTTATTPAVTVVRPLTPGLGAHAVLSSASPTVTAATSNAASVAYNLQQLGGSASNAIAAAASQAIVATQQMPQGRRTASLKASYEAIHGAGCGPPEFWISRDIANAATAAVAQTTLQTTTVVEKKQKKKLNTNSITHVNNAGSSSTPSSTIPLASSSSSVSVDSVDMLPSTSYVTAVGNIGLTTIGGSLTAVGGVAAIGAASSSAANRASSSLSSTTISSSTLAPTSNININDSGLVVEQTAEGEWSYDPNEPRYCTCNQVSYGDMVACDNDACPYEWFHYPCVGITQPPKGKWYCPKCTASMRRRGNRKN